MSDELQRRIAELEAELSGQRARADLLDKHLIERTAERNLLKSRIQRINRIVGTLSAAVELE